MERRKLTKEDIDKVRGIEGFPIGTDGYYVTYCNLLQFPKKPVENLRGVCYNGISCEENYGKNYPRRFQKWQF